MSVPDDGIDFLAAADAETNLDGVKFAYSPDFGIFTVDERVAGSVRDAAGAFEAAGATVEEVEVDFGYDGEHIIEKWMQVSRVKFAAMAERLRDAGVDLLGEHRDDVTPELLAVIEGGSDVSGIEYKRTDEVRTAVFDAIQDVFDDYDFLVSPTLATLPPEHGGLGPDEVEGESIDPMLGWFLTWPFNLTGHPAASLPAGLVDGLPVGLQLVGRRFADDDVLAASASFERERPWSAWYDRFDSRS